MAELERLERKNAELEMRLVRLLAFSRLADQSSYLVRDGRKIKYLVALLIAKKFQEDFVIAFGAFLFATVQTTETSSTP